MGNWLKNRNPTTEASLNIAHQLFYPTNSKGVVYDSRNGC